jgi:hypothetical protein
MSILFKKYIYEKNVWTPIPTLFDFIFLPLLIPNITIVLFSTFYVGFLLRHYSHITNTYIGFVGWASGLDGTILVRNVFRITTTDSQIQSYKTCLEVRDFLFPENCH